MHKGLTLLCCLSLIKYIEVCFWISPFFYFSSYLFHFYTVYIVFILYMLTEKLVLLYIFIHIQFSFLPSKLPLFRSALIFFWCTCFHPVVCFLSSPFVFAALFILAVGVECGQLSVGYSMSFLSAWSKTLVDWLCLSTELLKK